MDSTEPIGKDLDLYQFDVGAMEYSLDKVQTRAAPLDNERLANKISEALALTSEAGQIELEWDTHKRVQSSARSEAAATDNKIDRTLSSIYDVLKANAEMEADTRVRRLARELRGELFPGGVFPLTSPQYDKQHMHVRNLIERLNGEFAEHLEALGLQSLVDSLAQLNETFGEQLDLSDGDSVSYDQVQAARAEAREAFHKVVFMIYGDYVDQPDTRRELLAPIENQNERIGRYISRRGEAPNVDPDSGEPREPTDSNDTNPDGDGATPGEP